VLGVATGRADVARAGRSGAPGAAQHTIARLGAPVHAVAWHRRVVQGGADRARRLLSRLPEHEPRASSARPPAGSRSRDCSAIAAGGSAKPFCCPVRCPLISQGCAAVSGWVGCSW
jgi:hypothetical protein